VSSVAGWADPSSAPRSPAQIAIALLPPLAIAALLIARGFTGAPLWACALGLVGTAAWLVRSALRARLTRGWDLALLAVMLVPGALAAVPGEVAPIAPAMATVSLMIGRSILPIAGQVGWCVAAVLLAAAGALIGPSGPWTIAAVAFVLAASILVGIARRHSVRGEAAVREAELARHAAELAAARSGFLDPDAVRERFPQLSAREAEVLGLMARGRSNAEIAADLYLSVATVKSHVNALFAKLPARDRAHAIAIAYGTALPG